MIWAIVAYFVAPLGVILWLLLLSGVRQLESISQAVVSIDLAIGPVTLTVPIFFVALSGLVLSYETWCLSGDNPKSGLHPTTDRDVMGRWRAERNWWIMALSFVLWFTNWRLGTLLPRLRSKAM